MKIAEKSLFILVFPLVLVGGLDLSWGQVDPTSSVLLRRTSQSASENAFDSSRYEVTEPQGPIQDPKPVQPAIRRPQAPKQPEVVPPSSAIENPVTGATEKLDPSAVVEKHSNDSMAAAGSLLNVLELQVAPTYIYNHAQSNYWFRDHISSGSGLHLIYQFGLCRIWL